MTVTMTPTLAITHYSNADPNPVYDAGPNTVPDNVPVPHPECTWDPYPNYNRCWSCSELHATITPITALLVDSRSLII